MSDLPLFILLVLLVFMSAFFSSSETALINLSKIRLKHLVKEKVKNADKLEKLYEDSNKLLGAILIGNNIVNVATSSIATIITTSRFSNAGLGISVGLTTLVILIFGEITPKNLALKNSESISLFVAPIILFLVRIFTPILFILNNISNLLSSLLGQRDDDKKPTITQDELKTIVDVSNQEGVLETDETEMIQNIFEFKDLTVDDIMIQRMDIVAISSDMSYDEIIDVFKNKQLSRLPIYEDTIDDIIGVLYAKDLFFTEQSKEDFNLKTLMREPVFVNEFVKISDFFKKMQQVKTHIAIVLDEYGGVAGIVTMEDLVESIVGDIYDEYDQQDEEVRKVKENIYVINGNSKLTEIQELLQVELISKDYESLGGYLMDKMGKIPTQGDIYEDENFKFVISSMDKNRINKVKVIRK
ncbi:membrane protein, PF01595 family [Peptostreptococcaceae bacterium AS15]|nr:membrane protein, PF01595 family [Peptostreptococcaceae bacterium AS15]